MRLLGLFANLLVFLLTAWAICVSAALLFDIAIYFPFRVAHDDAIPYHRWQAVRIAIFLTFAYYGIVHLINGSKEVFPIHFLKVFLFAVSISGAFMVRKAGAPFVEYLIVLFFLTSAMILHLATRQRFKRYFGRK